MKIVIFGGAFDPPHKGHTEILKKAINYTDFDKVIVVPTGRPTHKESCYAPFDIRYLLSKTAFEKISSKVEVSRYEGDSIKPNYTYITLQHFKKMYDNSQIYLLIGTDSLLSIENWENSKYIFENCTILVFERETGKKQQIESKIEQLKKQGAKICFVENTPIRVSSSQCRDFVKSNVSLNNMLDNDVEKIIKDNKIYSDNQEEKILAQAKLIIKIVLPEKRYLHSINVAKVAVELAQIHNVDENKVRIAALLHDAMKYADKDILLHKTIQNGIIQNAHSKAINVLHGFAAAEYAERELNIHDDDILWAIRSHTCGRYGMRDIEKIVYLADMLSDERQFAEKEYILSLARENLNIAMVEGLKCSMQWVQQKGHKLDEDSLVALKYFESLVKNS